MGRPPPIPGIPERNRLSVTELPAPETRARQDTLTGLGVPPHPEAVESEPPAPHRWKLKHGETSFEGSGRTLLLVLAFAACGAGAFACGRYLRPPTASELEQASELRALREEVRLLRTELVGRIVEDEGRVRELGVAQKADRTAFVHNDSVMAETLRKLGAKVEWAEGGPPEDVDFHPAPLGGKAARVQPRAVLTAPP